MLIQELLYASRMWNCPQQQQRRSVLPLGLRSLGDMQQLSCLSALHIGLRERPPPLSGFLSLVPARHEQPPQRDDEPDASPHSEGRGRACGLDDRAARESPEEEEGDGEDPVVARADALAEGEEVFLRDELGVDGGEDHYGDAPVSTNSAGLRT